MRDETSGAVNLAAGELEELQESMKNLLARERDREGAGAGRRKLTFPMFLTMAGLILTMAGYGARSLLEIGGDRQQQAAILERLDEVKDSIGAVRREVAQVRGAQEKADLELVRISGDVRMLGERAAEDRSRIKSLENWKTYRLQFEARVKALHREGRWGE